MNILQMSFYGTVMIVAVSIIRLIAINKLPKKTFFVLWGITLVRLLVPFSVPSSFSLYTKIAPAEFKPDILFEPIQLSTNIDLNNAQVVNTSIDILNIVWIVGAVGLAVFFIATYFTYKTEFDMSFPIENEYLENWLNEHKIKRDIRIRQSSKINTPLTYGFFSPVILLPTNTDWGNISSLEYILTHEYIHIRRFDVVTKLILTLAVCIHWFNPLVWLMYLKANLDIELSCDESVIRSLGETEKSAYAYTLISMEESRKFQVSLCNYFCKNAIEERIVSIMKIKRPTVISLSISLVLVATVTAVLATTAAKSIPPETITAPIIIETEEPLEVAEETLVVAEEINSTFISPVEAGIVTAPFGEEGYWGHTGMDISYDKTGEKPPIKAAAAGTVTKVKLGETGYGNHLIIDHGEGIQTLYGHNESINVNVGDWVEQGDTIAIMGNTGNASEVHVHLELRENGKYINPQEYIK